MDTSGDLSGSRRNDHDYFGSSDTTKRSKEVEPLQLSENVTESEGIVESTMESNEKAVGNLNEFGEIDEEIVESSFTDDDEINEAVESGEADNKSATEKPAPKPEACDKATPSSQECTFKSKGETSAITVAGDSASKDSACPVSSNVSSEDTISCNEVQTDSCANITSQPEHSDVSISSSSCSSSSTSNGVNKSQVVDGTKSAGNMSQSSGTFTTQTEAKKCSNNVADSEMDVDLPNSHRGDSEENDASSKTCDSSAVSVASGDDFNDFGNDAGEEVDMSDVSSSFAEGESVGDPSGKNKSLQASRKPRRRQMPIMSGYTKRRKVHSSKKLEDDSESVGKTATGSDVFNSEAEGSVCDDKSEEGSQDALEESSSEENALFESGNQVPKLKRRCSSFSSEVADKYCWLCHKDSGVMYKCLACPRVFHAKCHSQSCNVDPGDDPCNFQCPECVAVLKADNVNTRSPTLATVNLDQLCTSLKHVISLLKSQKEAHYFTGPVDTKEFPHYREYVVHPMDLLMLEKNVCNKEYGCTEAFLADVKWIVHNSIVFNSKAAKITNVAKNLLKICKREIMEIETCAECYYNSIVRIDTWFIEVCKKPHLLVWARLKGYPPWPAKALKCKDGMVDCRFFGAHDKAWVPLKDCFLYSKLTPQTVKIKKGSHLESGILELEKHIKKLRDKFGIFVYPPPRMPYRPSQELEQLRLMLPNYNPSSSNRLSTKYLIHPDRHTFSAKRKVFSDQEEKPAQEGDRSKEKSPDCADSEGTNEPDKPMDVSLDDSINSDLSGGGSSSSDEYTASSDVETSNKQRSVNTNKTESTQSSSSSPENSSSSAVPDTANKKDADASAPSSTPAKADNSVADSAAGRKIVTVKNIEKINATVTSTPPIAKKPSPGCVKTSPTANLPESTSISVPRKASPLQSTSSQQLGNQLKRPLPDSVSVTTILPEDQEKAKDSARSSKKALRLQNLFPGKSPIHDAEEKKSENNSVPPPQKLVRRPDPISDKSCAAEAEKPQNKADDSVRSPPKKMIRLQDSSGNKILITKTADQDKAKDSIPPPKKSPQEHVGKPLQSGEYLVGHPGQRRPSWFDLDKVKDEPMETDDSSTSNINDSAAEKAATDKRPSSPTAAVETKRTGDEGEHASVDVVAKSKTVSGSDSSLLSSARFVNITENVTLSVVNQSPVSTDPSVASKQRAITVKQLPPKKPIRPLPRSALEEQAEIALKSKKSATLMSGPPPLHSVSVTAKSNVKILPRPASQSSPQTHGPTAAVKAPISSSVIQGIPGFSNVPARSSPKPVDSTSNTVSYTNGPTSRAPIGSGIMPGISVFSGASPRSPPKSVERTLSTPVVATVTSDFAASSPARSSPKPVESTPSIAAGVLDECLMTEYQTHFRKFFEDTLDKMSGKGDLRARVVMLQKEIDTLKRNHEYVIDELKRDYEMQIAELRATSIAKTQFDLAAERLKFEQEKERAVKEAKSKQWCSNCQRSANYYCCWNTAYCDFECQKDHWIQHVHVCKNDVKKKTAESSENEPPKIMMQNDVSINYMLNGFEKPSSTYSYQNSNSSATRHFGRVNVKNTNAARPAVMRPLLPRVNSVTLSCPQSSTSSPAVSTMAMASSMQSSVANKGPIRPNMAFKMRRESSQFDK